MTIFLIHSAPFGCHPDHSELLNTSTLGGLMGVSMLCMCWVPFIILASGSAAPFPNRDQWALIISTPGAQRALHHGAHYIPSNPTPHTDTGPPLQDQQGLSKEPHPQVHHGPVPRQFPSQSLAVVGTATVTPTVVISSKPLSSPPSTFSGGATGGWGGGIKMDEGNPHSWSLLYIFPSCGLPLIATNYSLRFLSGPARAEDNKLKK